MAPQMMWMGHAGFRISLDHEGTNYVVYIDPWLDHPKFPESLKEEGTLSDADLILITHGHFDHSASAPGMLANSTKPNKKIACIFEIGQYYQHMKGIDVDLIQGMGLGGSKDFGWCKITMVMAAHSSSCGMHEGNIVDGGVAAGFILRFGDYSIYHAGDTAVFLDMQLIEELYKPTHLIIPIGGNFTMGPEEAAFAVKRFFHNAHTVVPMHFGTFPKLPGTFDQFVAEMEKQGVQKRIVNSYEEVLGKWIDL